MASPSPKYFAKIHELVKVTPAKSTAEFCLPLTFFDTFWFSFPPVERLFFYQFTSLTPHLFNYLILPKLKQSLSLTLFHYLPLAGNLMWPSDAAKPAIYYFPNDGLSLTVAESNADFNLLSGHGIREAVEFHPLIPQLYVSDDKAAIIAIQITLFPNEGFSIGISAHHAILDGKSSTMFIKSWAHICKQDIDRPSLLPDLTPYFDRSVIKDPAGIDMVYINNWLAFTGSDSNSNSRSLKLLPSLGVHTNLVRATFELTREDIKKLRDMVQDRVKQSKELHLSTFVLTCAYAFICLVKAGGEEGYRKLMIAISVDCRSRLNPLVPANYFGNCVIGSPTMISDAKYLMEEDGVAFIAKKLSDLIKGSVEKGVVEGLEEKLVNALEQIRQGAKMIGVAGSPRFDVYGSDFGWGRPKKVEVVSIDKTGAISLAESRDGNGSIEVGIVLEKQKMEVFSSLFAGLKDLSSRKN